MPRQVVGGVALALLLALTGCRVDAEVDVVMREDGSGTVEVVVVLDEEAAAEVPDLADDLRVEDLEATGWTVTGPEETGEGVEIRAERPFATAQQARQILRQIGGPGGLLRDLEVERDHTFGQTEWSFDGVLDLSEGLASVSDSDLAELLGGEPVGRDAATLEEEFGQPVTEMLGVSVAVDLPGDEPVARWSADLGDDPVTMATAASERDLKVLGLAAGALAALLLLLLLFVVRAVRRRRRRRHT